MLLLEHRSTETQSLIAALLEAANMLHRFSSLERRSTRRGEVVDECNLLIYYDLCIHQPPRPKGHPSFLRRGIRAD